MFFKLSCMQKITYSTLLLFLMGCGSQTEPLESNPDSFASVFAHWRPVEGRLSGQTAYVGYQPGKNAALRSKHLSRLAAMEATFANLPEPDGEAVSLVNLARLDLFRGRFEEAINKLKRAKEAAPHSPAIENDLAVACLAAGEQDPQMWLQALEHIGHCFEAQFTPPEVLFNRGLILQKLSLTGREAAAWQAFLEASSQPGWQREARKHLQWLQKQAQFISWIEDADSLAGKTLETSGSFLNSMAAEYPESLRKAALYKSLPAWAQAMGKGAVGDASRHRDTVEKIGRELHWRYGDRHLLDISEQLSPEWAGVIEKLNKGLALYGHGQYHKARLLLEAAYQREGDAARHPLNLWTGYQLGLNYYQLLNQEICSSEELLDHLKKIESLRAGRPYLAFQSKLLSLNGLLKTKEGAYSESLILYAQALTHAKSANEVHAEIKIRGNTGVVWRLLDQPDRAFDEYLHGVCFLRYSIEREGVHLIYGRIAYAMLKTKKNKVAQYYFDTGVHAANQTKKASSIANTLRWRADYYYRMGATNKATRDLDEATALLKKIPYEQTRKNVALEIAITKGRFFASSLPAYVLENLPLAYQNLAADKDIIRLPQLDFWIARAHLAKGDHQAAIRRLAQGIGLVKKMRIQLREDELRISFFDQASDLYDALTDIYFSKGDLETALAITEEFKALFFVEKVITAPVSGHVAKPGGGFTGFDSLQKWIPAHTALISFNQIEDRILAWVFTQKTVTGHRYEFDRRAFNQALSLVISAPQKQPAEANQAELLDRLFKITIQPLTDLIEGKKSLLLIPDEDLWRLPFPALRRNDRYLLEDFNLAVLPSATHFQFAIRQGQATWPGAPQSVFAVGNPALDRQKFPAKADLPWAEQEARTIIRGYPNSNRIKSLQATPARFLEAAKMAQIVHFAGHTGINSRNPLASCMYLAPDNHGNGILTAGEIYQHRFRDTWLFILAGCESGASGESLTASGGGLARPFLAGGARSVIAALRPIGDSQNLAFAEKLHTYLLAGLPPGEALRQTQLARLQSGAMPFARDSVWAYYQVFGLP